MADINPYRAPQASVADVGHGDGMLAAEPRTVDASRGVAWISQGWLLFRQAPLIWVAIAAIGIVVMIAISVIPVLGQLVTSPLSILFAGGVMIGCRALDRGEELTIAHLVAGVQNHLSPLLTIGALYLAGMFVLLIAASLVTGGTAFAVFSGSVDFGAAFASIIIMVLIVATLMIPLAMAVWFAPALTTLHSVGATDAMKLSFKGCLRNTLPFLVYGIIVFVLALIAMIPLGLGWLVLLPVLAGSTYAAYNDIFVQQ
jgi:uncharacterized membrane protein